MPHHGLNAATPTRSRGRRFPPGVIFALVPALSLFCAFWLLPFATLAILGSSPDNSTMASGYWTILSSPRYLQSLLITLSL